MIAILVKVKLKPGKSEEFIPYILADARDSLRYEPGCKVFQVLQNQENPDSFVFYEVYTDDSALDYHRKQPHYLKFEKEAKHLIENLTISTYNPYLSCPN